MNTLMKSLLDVIKILVLLPVYIIGYVVAGGLFIIGILFYVAIYAALASIFIVLVLVFLSFFGI